MLPQYYISAFPKNSTQHAELARALRSHRQQVQPHFNSKFIGFESPFSISDAVISSFSCSTSKLATEDSRRSALKTESKIDLLSYFVDLFTSEEGNTLDPYDGSMSLAIVCVAKNRFCVFIEMNGTCVRLAEDRIASLPTLFTTSTSQQAVPLK